MELNNEKYKKAMEKISIPQNLDDNIIAMFEKGQFEAEKNSQGKKYRSFRISARVAIVAAAFVIVSCGSVFAYNKVMNAKLVNPAIGLDHSDNVDVNGNEYVYEEAEIIADAVQDENLSITLESIVADDSLAYIRFQVSTVNGESLITNEELKKSVVSMQQFESMAIKVNDTIIGKDSYFMFRVDSGNDESKAVLELTIQKAGNLAGKTISIAGTNFTDTYHTFDADGKFVSREKQILYKGTWNFACDVPSAAVSGISEYNGPWEVPCEDKIAVISYIKITDMQVFISGKIQDYVSGYSKQAQTLYLITEDGMKINAGVKMEGSNNPGGTFDRHYMLQNLVDADKVVAIEFWGNRINLK